jgi:hypothetical protein
MVATCLVLLEKSLFALCSAVYFCSAFARARRLATDASPGRIF